MACPGRQHTTKHAVAHKAPTYHSQRPRVATAQPRGPLVEHARCLTCNCALLTACGQAPNAELLYIPIAQEADGCLVVLYKSTVQCHPQHHLLHSCQHHSCHQSMQCAHNNCNKHLTTNRSTKLFKALCTLVPVHPTSIKLADLSSGLKPSPFQPLPMLVMVSRLRVEEDLHKHLKSWQQQRQQVLPPQAVCLSDLLVPGTQLLWCLLRAAAHWWQPTARTAGVTRRRS